MSTHDTPEQVAARKARIDGASSARMARRSRKMMRHELAKALAPVFSAELRGLLSADEMRAIVAGNKTADSGVCCSHDYCDTNVVMDAAWRIAFGREMDLQSDSDISIWNMAWQIAKDSGFAV